MLISYECFYNTFSANRAYSTYQQFLDQH
jgi:hypothetical protein